MRRRHKSRSLATRFSVFAALLVGWLAAVEVTFEYASGRDALPEHLLSITALLAVSVVVARITSRAFVQPLVLLERAMAAVKAGDLDPIQVSGTGDEIERLGIGFNEMIQALGYSRRQVQEHREHLEERIRERTEALKSSMERAEAATRAKSEFLSNMSHELRTPLNGVQGMLDIVLEGDVTPTQREELETARECSQTLLALVNDILDLSKIEAGMMTLEKIPFGPREVVAGCARPLMPKAAQKKLLLTCDVSPEVPAQLMGDPLRLRQVILNLLSNAIKYTNEGTVTLVVTSAPVDTKDSVRLRFDVVDTGIGIPRDKLETIFEEFTQADGSITRRYGGTGLGLSISRKLVQTQGGRLWVESEVGRGSAFHFEIEFEVSPAAPGLPVLTAASDAAPAPDGKRTSRGRILVVEDNLINQQVVAGLLSKRRYEPTVVNHGGQALAALEASSYDLVIMDVQMPVMDGLETTRRIRQDERWRSLPIIGLTAHAMAGDRERCIEAGMDDYLPKPVRPIALIETIKRNIGPRCCPVNALATIDN